MTMTYLMISQNLAPIWLPHWPAWMWTISLIVEYKIKGMSERDDLSFDTNLNLIKKSILYIVYNM